MADNRKLIQDQRLAAGNKKVENNNDSYKESCSLEHLATKIPKTENGISKNHKTPAVKRKKSIASSVAFYLI